MVVSSKTAMAVHETAGNRSKQFKLEVRILKLEQQLGIAEGSRWTPASPEFQAAGRQVAQQKVAETQLQIAQEVSLLLSLTAQRRQYGPADKNTRRLQRSAMKKHKQIRLLLGLLQRWAAFMLPEGTDPPPAYSDDRIMEGDLPWLNVHASAGISHAHVLFHHHMVVQEQRRCEEHLQLLPRKAANAVALMSYQLEVVQERLTELQCSALRALPPCSQLMAQASIVIAGMKALMLRHKEIVESRLQHARTVFQEAELL